MRFSRVFVFLCAPFLVAASVLLRAEPVAEWQAVSHMLRPSGAIDFTPHGTQPGLAYLLWKSDDCAGCHGAGGAATSAQFRPHPTWAGSMMANATRDPLFWAALDVANNDVPGVGDYCLRCHTSEGWYGGRVVKQGFGQPDNDVTKGAAGCLLEGAYDAPDSYSDFGGLGCHFCHRQMPQGPAGQPLPGNGAVWIDDQPCPGGGEPCRRGPYDYAGGGGAPHEWAHSPFHTESAICGQCHDVTTPDTATGPLKTLKLANGTDTGVPFPIERTYSEWQRSAYAAPTTGKTCQNCHMPDSLDPDASACTLGGYPNRTGNLPTHAFAGGNTWIPGILKGEYSHTSPASPWGGIGRQEAFDQIVAWAREMLASAATVETALGAYVAPTAGSPGSLAVDVKVTNHGGHKLPSGYGEGRRMWLNVQLRDAAGDLVAESAAYDAGTAVLTVDAQARVYEVLQGIWNRNGTGACDVADAAGNAMFHFVLNDCVAKDNRIPPLGFKPRTAADPNGYEVGPVPASAYPETAPGSGTLVNYDRAAYAFAIPAGRTGPFTATARLYYQTASKEYIEFLRDEAADHSLPGENQLCSGASNRPFVVGPQNRTRGQYLYDLWNDAAYGKSPPELVGVAGASTDRIFADGFDRGASPSAGPEAGASRP